MSALALPKPLRNPSLVIGGAIIVVAGIYVWHRETRDAKSAQVEALKGEVLGP